MGNDRLRIKRGINQLIIANEYLAGLCPMCRTPPRSQTPEEKNFGSLHGVPSILQEHLVLGHVEVVGDVSVQRVRAIAQPVQRRHLAETTDLL